MALKYGASGCLALHFIPPLLHHRYAEVIEIFIGSTFCDQVGIVSIKKSILQELVFFSLHHMCLKIMSGKLESTKVESPVALAVLC